MDYTNTTEGNAWGLFNSMIGQCELLASLHASGCLKNTPTAIHLWCELVAAKGTPISIDEKSCLIERALNTVAPFLPGDFRSTLHSVLHQRLEHLTPDKQHKPSGDIPYGQHRHGKK